MYVHQKRPTKKATDNLENTFSLRLDKYVKREVCVWKEVAQTSWIRSERQQLYRHEPEHVLKYYVLLCIRTRVILTHVLTRVHWQQWESTYIRMPVDVELHRVILIYMYINIYIYMYIHIYIYIYIYMCMYIGTCLSTWSFEYHPISICLSTWSFIGWHSKKNKRKKYIYIYICIDIYIYVLIYIYIYVYMYMPVEIELRVSPYIRMPIDLELHSVILININRV